jgi:hypothetical protein
MLRRSNGQQVKLVQFANDWIMVDEVDGKSAIVTPLAVRVETEEERQTLLSTVDSPSVGFFWRAWELLEDGTFRKKGLLT